MDRKVYNWERYWVSREGAFSFDYDGFLLPPSDDTRWRSTQRTGVLKFEDIAPKPCLVLLGEPGIGKTFAVSAQVARRSALHLNLGSYGAEQRLIDIRLVAHPLRHGRVVAANSTYFSIALMNVCCVSTTSQRL